MAIDKVTLSIEIDGDVRATEILADLRSVAETLFYPMKLAGFWDYKANLHLCPQEERREACPHNLPADHPQRVEYVRTLQRERRASIELNFPHAEITIYLS